MPEYRVEEMRGERAVSRKLVLAPTPFAAATMATNREVTLDVDRKAWLRVTQPGRPPFEYGYLDPAAPTGVGS